METIKVQCASCQMEFGKLVNLWTQIGKSYCSPLVAPNARLDVRVQGPLRNGETATLVEGCQLQDVACQKCRAVIGIECLAAPTNHVLDKGQFLLRKSAFAAVKERGGKPVELHVKRFLKLREAGRASGGPPASNSENGAHASSASAEPDDSIAGIQEQIETQRADIDRLDSAGYQIVAAMDAAVHRIGGEVAALQETIRGLQRDLGGSQDDTASLKAEVQGMKELVKTREKAAKADSKAATAALEDSIGANLRATTQTLETVKRDLEGTSIQLRSELSAAKSELHRVKRELGSMRKSTSESASSSAKVAALHAKELEVLRAEMAELRQQMQEVQQERAAAKARATITASSFGSQEIDIIMSNIAKLGSRASQVETLQMEFAILKGRVQRLESAPHSQPDSEAVANRTSTNHGEEERRGGRPSFYETPDDTPSNFTGLQHEHASTIQKEAFYGVPESLSKNTTRSMDKKDARENGIEDRPPHKRSLKRPSSPALPSTGAKRITKAGTTDKRHLRRGSRKTG